MIELSNPPTVQEYADLLDARTPFTLANYGDGEWNCIVGNKGGNCQGGLYTPELRDALRATLVKPARDAAGDDNYFYGTNCGKKLDEVVTRWRLRQLADRGNMRWVWKETFSSANVRGELGPVLKALRRRRVLIVGPRHVNEWLHCGKVIDPIYGITVPDRNCFSDIKTGVPNILEVAELFRVEVICFSAGMAAKVMMHRVHREIGDRVTLLDMGACWDPYVGHLTRKGYRKRDILTRLARNVDDGRPVDEITADLAMTHIAVRQSETNDGHFAPKLERALVSKYELAAAWQPKSICEIGVRAGYAAYMMLAAAPDATYMGIDKNVVEHGGRLNSYRLAESFLARFEPTIMVADSQAMTSLPGRHDLVHVDGDHSYEGCKHDIELAFQHADMAVAVDDYHNIEAVKRACDDFASKNPYVPTYTIDDGGQRGTFVIDVARWLAEARP